MQSYRKQSGAALAVSLIMLIMLAILSTAGIRTSILEEKMSQNLQNSEIAFQAAEVALKGAENWLMAMTTEPTPQSSCTTFPCVEVFDSSLYPQELDNTWWASNSTTYSGTTVSGVHSNPQYIVEYLRFVSDGGVQIGTGIPTGKHYYRITARGVGSSPQAVTILRATIARRF
jgi:type IV pilus assembly protein PilX